PLVRSLCLGHEFDSRGEFSVALVSASNCFFVIVFNFYSCRQKTPTPESTGELGIGQKLQLFAGIVTRPIFAVVSKCILQLVREPPASPVRSRQIREHSIDHFISR